MALSRVSRVVGYQAAMGIDGLGWSQILSCPTYVKAKHGQVHAAFSQRERLSAVLFKGSYSVSTFSVGILGLISSGDLVRRRADGQKAECK